MNKEKYTVFARKYRAQSFVELVGQKHVVQTLKNAVLSGQIGHAYLFAGPRGVGKTSMARILAKSLNCKEGPTDLPCNVCDSCLTISRGNALDVIEIDGASNRRIDDIRHLIEQLKYPPVSGADKKKIYIIDEVHMLTNEAFNALLKSLEEPPPHVIFIFATTEPFKVPPTILSRCQRFDFRRISLQDINNKLRDIGKKENIDVDDEVYGYIGLQSEGSLRDAEVMLDQLSSFSEGLITVEMVQDFLGIVPIDWVMKVLQHIVSSSASGGIEVVSDLYSRGLNLNDFLHSFLKVLRDLILISAGDKKNRSILYFPEENYTKWTELISKIKSQDILISFMRIVEKTYTNIKYSESGNLEVEVMIAELLHLYELYDIDELISYARAARIKDQVHGKNQESPQENEKIPADEQESAPSPSKVIVNAKDYDAFCKWVESTDPKLYDSFLKSTIFHSFGKDAAHITMKDISKLFFKERQGADWTPVVRLMRNFFHSEQLDLEVNWADSSFKDGKLIKSGLKDEVKNAIPEIKTLVDAFGGNIHVKPEKKENQNGEF